MELWVVHDGESGLSFLVWSGGLNLVALVHVDHELLKLFVSYPQYTHVDTVEEDDVCGQGDKPNEPARCALSVKEVTSECTHKSRQEVWQVTSKQCPLWVSQPKVVRLTC